MGDRSLPRPCALNVVKLSARPNRPYCNLDAFTEADARFFFGRERAIDEMVDSLRKDPRFLAVLGPSGSGKSSIVQAGLIAKLRQGAVPDSDRWEIIVTRPSDRSFMHLVSTLDQVQQQHTALIIDQFEELFVISSDEAKLQDITTRLTRLLRQPNISIIVTLRDDFYSCFAEQEMLVKWLKRGLVNIPSMLTLDELTDIVQEPARVVGLSFEEGLVETIVKDAMEAVSMSGKLRPIGRSTILPLLEFTLTQLWKRREEGMLTHSAYKRVGGVTGSLTQWADTTFCTFDEQQRLLARRILTDLVHLGDQDQRIPDSRRRRELPALSRYEEEREDVSQVVQQLVIARLLVMSQDAQSKKVMVEIIHDALLQEWGVLRQWVEEDRRLLMWHQELERAVQAWIKTAPDDSSQRDRDKPLRGRDLLEAESWLESRSTTLSRTERDFIGASREQQKQEEQRWKEWYEKSERQRQTVLANHLANQAEWIRDQQTHKLQLSMLLAVESIQRSPSSKAAQLLREGLTLLPLSVSSLAYDKRIHSITLSPNGRLLAVADGGNLVEIYSMPNVHKIAQLEHDDCVRDITFSPDGRLLATASRDHGVRIWSVHGDKIAQLKHDNQVLTVTFSSDGLYLATTGLDYTARLWSIKDLQELVRFVHREGV